MPDRVLHLNWIPDPGRWPGVVAKLGQIAAAACRHGIPLDVAVVARPGPNCAYPIAYHAKGQASRWQERLLRFDLLERSCPLDRYRAIILRYSAGPDPSLWRLLSRHGRRIVTEHHSIEPQELASLHPGVFGHLRSWAETIRQGRMLGGVAGCIAMTHGIATRLRRLAPPDLPLAIIPNGIEVGVITCTGFTPWRGGPLALGMLCGDVGPWFGIDRILAGLEAEPDQDIVLHLAGPPPTGELLARCRCLGERVRIHGILRGHELDHLCSTWNLALAALGMHRKGLAEACTLKVREYLARGLPFAISHQDPDLPPFSGGCHLLPADDQPVTCAQMARMAADAARHEEGLGRRLRAWAEARCDWEPLIRRMHDAALAATDGGRRLESTDEAG